MIEDMRWFGLWMAGGTGRGWPLRTVHAKRAPSLYRDAWQRLLDGAGFTPAAAHAKIWQWPCRPRMTTKESIPEHAALPPRDRWRTRSGRRKLALPHTRRPGYRVPGWALRSQRFVAGQDFGDFLVWRRDDLPSYQLAVVVDDAAMQVTEVVRGADLLKSTARQILLARALGVSSPAWYHCDLLRDERGQRLAKRHDALSLRRVARTGKASRRSWYQRFHTRP